MIRLLEKNYLKFITHCRYHRYCCWCSVWISCCWNISLVDLQEKKVATRKLVKVSVAHMFCSQMNTSSGILEIYIEYFSFLLGLSTIFSSLSAAL